MNKKVKINFGFTTVELLVAVTVLAILAILVVTVINPIDLLKQGKDSNRVASLNAVNNALRFLTENEPGTFIGTSSVVYVSIPSTVSDCSNLGLPTLPSGWTYGCATSANLRKIDGTGWIPVNFSSLPAGSPISELPVDSKNSTSTRNYFTYVGSGKSWELNFSPEANKNKLSGDSGLVIKDGGDSPSLFEIGNDLFISPLDYGDSSLMGYWGFEEGSGSVARDGSGINNYGNWNGAATHYVGGRVGKYAGSVNVGTDYVLTTNASAVDFTAAQPYTISLWLMRNGSGGHILGKRTGCLGQTLQYELAFNASNALDFNEWDSSLKTLSTTTTVPLGVWSHVAFSYSGSNAKMYLNGQLLKSSNLTFASNHVTGALSLGKSGTCTPGMIGYLDNVRMYNRELTIFEIRTIFNAGN